MDPHLMQNCYWEVWHRRALAAGVSPALANLGQMLMRCYYYQDAKGFTLGDEAHGQFMLNMCLQKPAEAELEFVKQLRENNHREASAVRLGDKSN